MTDDGGVLLEIRRPPDIATVRRAVGRAMDELGASALRRTRLVTAASELARNALVHGGGGRMEMQIRKDGRGGGSGVVLKFRDEGPGIADVERALRDRKSAG